MRYARDIGFLGIFAIIGYMALIFKKNKEDWDLFLLFYVIALCPVLHILTYVPTLILPLISLIIAEGIMSTFSYIMKLGFNKEVSHYLIRVCIIMIIVITLSVSAVFQVWHPGLIQQNEDSRFLKISEESVGEWLLSNTHKNIIGNDILLMNRLAILGPCKFIGRNIPAVACDYISNVQVKKNSPFKKAFWTEPFFSLNKTEFRYDVESLLVWFDVNRKPSQQFYQDYDIGYFVSSRGVFLRNDIMYQSVAENKNRIFDNGKNVVWDLS